MFQKCPQVTKLVANDANSSGALPKGQRETCVFSCSAGISKGLLNRKEGLSKHQPCTCSCPAAAAPSLPSQDRAGSAGFSPLAGV